MLFVYSRNLCNAILKIWMNLHRFQIKLWLLLSDSISRRGTFSVFNITAHGYIFIYIQNQMYVFLLYKQATFYNKCSLSIRKFAYNSYEF